MKEEIDEHQEYREKLELAKEEDEVITPEESTIPENEQE